MQAGQAECAFSLPKQCFFSMLDVRAMCCRLEKTQMPTQRSRVGRRADSVLMRDRSKVSCYGTALCCQDDGHLEANGPEAAHLSLSTIKIVYTTRRIDGTFTTYIFK